MIKTTQELCDYIEANFKDQIGDHRGPLDAAVWFCCIEESKNFSGYDLKDLARVIQGGLPSYDNEPHACIQEWIDLHIAYCAESSANDEEFVTIEQLLEDFYKPKN